MFRAFDAVRHGGAALALAVAALFFAAPQAEAAYEYEAFIYSEYALTASYNAYVTNGGFDGLYYDAYVYAYYGNYYADYAYNNFADIYFYDAYEYHYAAYQYYDYLYSVYGGRRTYRALLFNYYALYYSYYAYVT